MAEEQQQTPGGQSAMDVVRSYAALVILVIIVQVILAFVIIRTLVIGRLGIAEEDSEVVAEEFSETPEEEMPSDKPVILYDIPKDFLTNPNNVDRIRFVKAHVQLGLSSEPVLQEIHEIEPKLIDIIISILMSKSVSEMDDPPDREVIKDEIKISLNKLLTQGEITSVYLTAFLIQ